MQSLLQCGYWGSSEELWHLKSAAVRLSQHEAVEEFAQVYKSAFITHTHGPPVTWSWISGSPIRALTGVSDWLSDGLCTVDCGIDFECGCPKQPDKVDEEEEPTLQSIPARLQVTSEQRSEPSSLKLFCNSLLSKMDMDTNTTTSSTTTSMSASMMAMTFFTSTSTPIYSSMWTPTNIGQYAGTCIFLIILATVFRALLAVKQWKETAWMDAEFNRRYVTVAGKLPKSERISSDPDTKRMILTENGVEEEVMVVKKRSMGTRPWRITVDPVRACLDTVIAGVGYLLMLAVMTVNVGYFLSILGGTFLGSLALGRYNPASMEH
ncbi:hypothetical protein G7Y89_g9017 [Cudoniella acicularis]|uniref:Copper transport protein n=1 Tax=Cudoniella acicularis TaxID=354080 RepID=A0A8H4W0I5_9HELO|nr:hypothetical protein G7Y89_g9017 [Cudoniella acicularis]